MSLYSFSPTRPCFRLCTIDGMIRCFLISYHLLPKLQVTLVNSDIHYSFIPSPPPQKNTPNSHQQKHKYHKSISENSQLLYVVIHTSCFSKFVSCNHQLSPPWVFLSQPEPDSQDFGCRSGIRRSHGTSLDKIGRKAQEFPVMWGLEENRNKDSYQTTSIFSTMVYSLRIALGFGSFSSMRLVGAPCKG